MGGDRLGGGGPRLMGVTGFSGGREALGRAWGYMGSSYGGGRPLRSAWGGEVKPKDPNAG